MVQSRLNKRIKKVQNNISGRQKLLSKLYRIKLEQAKKKSSKKQRLPKRPITKSKSPKKQKRRHKKQKKRSKVSPRRRVRKVSKPKVVNNNLNGRNNNNLNVRNNNAMNVNGRNNNAMNVNGRNNLNGRNNNEMNVNRNNNYLKRGNAINVDKCVLKNVHDEMVEIPTEYPGDLWVHNNLEHQRDKPLEYFNDEHLKDIYGHHRKICFGN